MPEDLDIKKYLEELDKAFNKVLLEIDAAKKKLDEALEELKKATSTPS